MKNEFTILKSALIYAVIAAIAVITLGVLVIPVVMAFTYSCYWLFLYIGYLVIALIIAAFVGGSK